MIISVILRNSLNVQYMCQFLNIINCHYTFSVVLPEVNYKIIVYTDMVHFVELLKYHGTFPIVYTFTSHTHMHTQNDSKAAAFF